MLRAIEKEMIELGSYLLYAWKANSVWGSEIGGRLSLLHRK